jgi:hypothetical protein
MMISLTDLSWMKHVLAYEITGQQCFLTFYAFTQRVGRNLPTVHPAVLLSSHAVCP